jgi:hypothetical protein
MFSDACDNILYNILCNGIIIVVLFVNLTDFLVIVMNCEN